MKAGAASGVGRGIWQDRLRRQRDACLVCVDDSVLGAVIRKHALDVGHESDEGNVDDKDGHAHRTLDEVAQDPM